MTTISPQYKQRYAAKTSPLVSVIMPVYNAEKYLAEAIDSILNQTFQNFELIIIDDASTDSSPKIIQRYKKRYPAKIQVITMKKNVNRGGDSCANTGIRIARGEYIARMDADDIARPRRFEKQIALLQKDPDLFMVGTNAVVIDSNGRTIGEKLEPLTSEDIRNSYFTFHPIIHPSVMFRKYIRLNGRSKLFQYKTKYSANNDYYTFFSLLCQGQKIINLKEKLLEYRVHGKNDTFVNVKEKFMNTLKVRIEMVRDYGYRPTTKQIITTIIQSVVLLTLPEALTIKLYLLAKGIISYRDVLPALPSFASLKARISLIQ